MAISADNTIPKGPPDLCFDSNSFTKEPFSVDQFLQDHRNKANLETMRDDLGVYLKVLRSAMIELINKDYADFVNLSSNLIGLDKAINSIQTPLGQLREELLQVRQSIDEAMSDVSKQLDRRHNLRDQKRSLKSLTRVQTALKKLKLLLANAEDGHSLDTLTLERAVAEFNQLQFNVSKCQQHITKKDEEIFESVGNLLLKSVDQLFLDSLSLGEKGKSGLISSLSFYLMLGKRDEAERLYRQRIVAVAMNPLINEESLRSLPRGLPALYEKIIQFADSNMKYIREVTKDSEKFPGIGKFNFFVRSFWPEVEYNLEVNLTSIYAAGDPDMFYQRYCETLKFVDQLGKRCNNPAALSELYTHSDFVTFMEKWNLPVYFQIRFQEIVKTLEGAFASEEWASKSNEWKLLATETAWHCLNRCWEPGVFLTPIAHKFWKLSLQIISRYCTWIGQTLSKKPLFPKNETTLDFSVNLYSDIETYVKRLEEFETKAINTLPSITEKTSLLLHKSLEESKLELQSRLKSVSNVLVQSLMGDSNLLLRQVSDIPRLFRRTNRETPNKPCSYVTSLLEAPQNFYKKHQDHPETTIWLQSLFSDISKQYYSCVAEVLTSVQKTEESLRRLKKARDRTTNAVQPNDRRAGDDDKIRLQLLLDVQAFYKGVEQLGVKKSNVEKLGDLLLLVETTQRS